MNSAKTNTDATKFVVDTSALLAMLQDAPGGSLVGATLNSSAVSTLTLSEVLEYSSAQGIDTQSMSKDLAILGLQIVPFTEEDAEQTAELARYTPKIGLSLSDRACLALAARIGIPALTADKRWKDLNLSVEIQVLR